MQSAIHGVHAIFRKTCVFCAFTVLFTGPVSAESPCQISMFLATLFACMLTDRGKRGGARALNAQAASTVTLNVRDASGIEPEECHPAKINRLVGDQEFLHLSNPDIGWTWLAQSSSFCCTQQRIHMPGAGKVVE